MIIDHDQVGRDDDPAFPFGWDRRPYRAGKPPGEPGFRMGILWITLRKRLWFASAGLVFKLASTDLGRYGMVDRVLREKIVCPIFTKVCDISI